MPLPGEFELIARYFAPLARHPGAFGLKDDAAVFEPRTGFKAVCTVDALVGGVHFLLDDPPDLIARKALRVNLSDLAAMGAIPLGYLLAFAVTKEIDERWVAEFARGLGDDQQAFGVSLLGGDTVASSGPPTISITAIGEIEADAMGPLERSTAHGGDDLYVSGTIGDAALGLAVLRGRHKTLDAASRDYLIDRYRLPQPRIELARAVRLHARAGIDVSDGLVQDLGHLAAASGLGAEVELRLIPFSLAARAANDPMACIVGGDDYELLFTAAADEAGAIAQASARTGVAVTLIGRMTGAAGVRVFGADGKIVPIARGGFTHF